MKLARWHVPAEDAEAEDGSQFRLIVDGEIIGERAVGFPDGSTVRDVLESGPTWSPILDRQSWPLPEVTLLAPIPDPGTVYAIALNYAKHVAETGAQAPEVPVVFVKVRSSVAPPGGPIRCPEVARRVDYEGQLAIAIGGEGPLGGYFDADVGPAVGALAR